MPLEHAVDARQFLERLGQQLLHGRLVGAGRPARVFRYFLRGADAGHHVLALGIDEKLAIEALLAGRGVAGEGDPGGGGVAHIAEHHGLHVDGRAPMLRNAVQAAIGDGALVHPGAEHRPDGAPQLRMRVLRERLAMLLRETLLVAGDQRHPIVGIEIGIEGVARPILVVVEELLEVMMLDAEHDVGIHGDEAPIAVIGEAAVAGLLRQRLDGHVVETEIEHRVHHAGHGGARAGAHGHQERIGLVAEGPAGDAADLGERGVDLPLQMLRIGLGAGVIGGADLGGDGEARRHRQAEIGHLGEPGPLAAEEIAHAGASRRLAAPEGIDPFAALGRARRFGRRRLAAAGGAADVALGLAGSLAHGLAGGLARGLASSLARA